MLAMYNVRTLGKSAKNMAEMIAKCSNQIHYWEGCFDADGLKGLCDLSRSGRSQ